MAGYSPLKITGNSTGLVQERENFLLPDDAYPVLQNAYVWRERIKRKKGYQLLGRLQRLLAASSFGNTGASPWTFNAYSTIVPPITEVTPEISGIALVFGGITFTDNGDGTLSSVTPGNSGVINYETGVVTLIHTAGAAVPVTGQLNYYPNLPVMGIRTLELKNSENDQTIVFDQKYAYLYNSSLNVFEEFLPLTGTTWNAQGASFDATDFFWSTNYWVSDLTNFPAPPSPSLPQKLFWVTNNTGAAGGSSDPVRITDGTIWIDFYPTVLNPGVNDWSRIDATNYLVNWLSMLPFRGRMVVFNTWEGTNPSSAKNSPNRIRWSTIGNPFIPYSAGPPAKGSWRDDIRGQGGFLDIPTSEDIIAVGFVRDNLVIYCERSTWQLRYTGRSIAPFQIEKVNSELGAEGPFSSIQFDTSLVGIGDKGIVECDSYKSERIDIKIPDLVFQFNGKNNGPYRVHGIRDFQNRLAYWTFPLAEDNSIFPTQRLVYNYENDSWALFNDSLTALGTFQPTDSRTWLNTHISWVECNFPWINQPAEDPVIVGGNQQGFVEYLDVTTANDVSLFIRAITANTVNSTVITSPNHNMKTGFVIEISGIPIGTPFASSLNNPQAGLISAVTQANPAQVTSVGHHLKTGDEITINGVVGMTELNMLNYFITVIDEDNFTLDGIDSTSFTPYSSGGTWTSLGQNVFGIVVKTVDTFSLFKYDPVSMQFSDPKLDVPTTDYVGHGRISIRENFSIKSKKFNFLDEGQSIQLGYIDILMAASETNNPGAISLNVYLDYDDVNVSNTLPNNVVNNGISTLVPDTFFNSVIPTTQANLNGIKGTKFWQRVFCSTQASFLTLEYTFSNAQMAGEEQEQDVQIDAQVLWIRKGGRMTQI